MMAKGANIVIFSSGVTEKKGILSQIEEKLEARGHRCANWRDLFASARDADNIALLPMLIKKIPSFDYAVLICEGHDDLEIHREKEDEHYKAMRDNVLFEIGLCCMALGLSRVILLTDHDVRLPEDLTGVNQKLAIQQFQYDRRESASQALASDLAADYITALEEQADQVDEYIRRTRDTLDQVIIGSAASIACSYASNFIIRLLEHIDEGIYLKESDKASRRHFDLDKIWVTIIVPEIYTEESIEESRGYFESFQVGAVDARARQVEFRYVLREDGSIHIYDYPTNIVTAYTVAKIILGMKADDTEDEDARERFISKELDLFVNALRRLTARDHRFIKYTVETYYRNESPEKKEQMLQRICDVIDNRFRITIAEDNYLIME